MSTVVTYARAALPLVPGASLLPFVAGRGKEMPALERSASGVRVDPAELAAYDRVCGFTLRDALPATYLHIKAFPMHMALMTDGKFPFPAVGLVHLSNRIVVHRPALVSETFDLVVRATPIEPHAKGRTFALVSEARVDGELVWEDVSTMLRRGGGSADARNGGIEGGGSEASAEERGSDPVGAGQTRGAPVEWRLAGDLGRRYGSVSGDRNPIHMHALSARLFGFPQAIAHGMWTKARCLAALESTLPDAYTVDVSFRKPILLPSRVTFSADEGRFAVRSAKRPETIHLEGTVTP
ncbi:MAG TPA: MaoC/PaaZ C-terminal domain-containing protein [Conexibacter sp.]|nr:MaoC/PaaZ C-terminal domain-containing protein [Conexibacter sp.]